MMLTVRDLIALLQTLPGDLEVTTWDAEFQEEHAIEQVCTVHHAGKPAVVMGMEIRSGYGAPVVVWTAHEVARKGLERCWGGK